MLFVTVYVASNSGWLVADVVKRFGKYYESKWRGKDGVLLLNFVQLCCCLPYDAVLGGDGDVEMGELALFPAKKRGL